MRRLIICTFLLSLPAWGAWIEISSANAVKSIFQCRSPHGERGLKSIHQKKIRPKRRRSPHGERGLKSDYLRRKLCNICCRSPHGERGLKSQIWEKSCLPLHSRSPHGERGLKWHKRGRAKRQQRRSPHGERGLKCVYLHEHIDKEASLPAWGAWIEILST